MWNCGSGCSSSSSSFNALVVVVGVGLVKESLMVVIDGGESCGVVSLFISEWL